MCALILRRKPRVAYCGLTVILSNPSRFDSQNKLKPNQGLDNLLSATGGQLFNDFCLRPDYNIMQCDIRLADDESPFLEGTKCVLLLGEYAMHKYVPDSRENTLNELRGSPLLTIGSTPAIASFLPQDAADIKNYEAKYNEESKDFEGGEDSSYQQDDEDGSEKSLSPTKRANYAFWLRNDIRKCKQIIQNGLPKKVLPIYKVYPSSEEVISILQKEKGKFLYFDIETDYEEQNLLCFAFSFFDNNMVYSVPMLDYNYKLSYSNYSNIMLALSIAIRDNTLVVHNGASFDFQVLCYKYGIPVGKCYDTMLAAHRCFPDIEKSLGHLTSLWTWERFHKDTDSASYRTENDMMNKLLYCGKDVFTLSLIHQAIDKYATTIPGLRESIDCANRSIRPYLTCSMLGMRYSPEKKEKVMTENDRLMNQYIRIIKLLIGSTAENECKQQIKSGKAKAFPGSNTQCVHYFHEMLGYPVLFRSKITQKPSLAAGVMYRLRLMFPDNPVITFILLYRSVAKESGTLKFLPFKDDDNKIIKESDYRTEEITRGFGASLLRSV